MNKIYCLFLIVILGFTARTSAQDSGKTDEIKPSIKVWGMIFGDAQYRPHADSLLRGTTQYAGITFPDPHNFSSFDIRRLYLGGDITFSRKISAEVLLASEGDVDNQRNATLSVKLANISINNIYKNANLYIGRAETPAFAMLTEKVWGYRSIEKTIADMRSIATSVDLGVSLRSKLNDSGTAGYNLMIGNGSVGAVPSGQRAEDDMFKKFYGDIWAKLLDKRLILDLYGDYERVQLTDLATGRPYHKSRYAVKGFAAWQTDKFTVGLEAFAQTYQNFSIYQPNASAKIDTTDAVALGVSAYIKGKIIKEKLGYFVRYDNYNPDAKFNPTYIYKSGNITYTEQFITVGLDWMPYKNLHIMPNIWVDAYHDQIYKVGRAANDYDMSLRLTFYYVYR